MQNRPITASDRRRVASDARRIDAEYVMLTLDLDPKYPLLRAPWSGSRPHPLEMHIHEPFEIGVCHAGEGIFEIEEKVFSFIPGDVFFINHLEFHRAYMPAGNESQWDFVYVDIVGLLAGAFTNTEIFDTARLAGRKFPNRFPAAEYPTIHRLANELVEEDRAQKPHYRDVVRAIVMWLMLELTRAAPDAGVAAPGRSYQTVSALIPALELIARDLAEDLPVEMLAEACGMSETHFRRRFTHLMGRSPQDYVAASRIARACNDLAYTTRSITDIAFAYGFGTISSFNRQFRKRCGCTPREWRQQH